MPEKNGGAVVAVGKTTLNPYELRDSDVRGVIWVWEGPRPNANYVLGVDTTVGITGWDRELRSEDDVKVDNAAIQVIRVGNPDVQVAEFAAPVDHYELARYVNFLGRMYCGANEDSQGLACIEMNNGGWATQTELVNKYGYTNLPPWRTEGGLAPHITQKFGWYSSRSTRKDLWVKGMRHINGNAIRINSPWLAEEMTDCTWDNFLAMTARGIYGSHDDRVVALLIAIWYAHEWSLEWAPTETAPAQQADLPDYQASAMTAEEMSEEFDERVASHWQW